MHFSSEATGDHSPYPSPGLVAVGQGVWERAAAMAHHPPAGPAARTTRPLTTTAPPAAADAQGDATASWLSTERMTICVDVDAAGIIVVAAPIVRKFLGQPATNLGRWLRRQPGFRCQKL